VRTVAASRDSPWCHIAWSQALDLDFPLLSDFNGDAVRAFGVAREWRGLDDVALRTAFLIDREGIVRGVWQYGDSELPDLDELVAAARALD
jgi:glutaredoxin-dependent peroxiredoxin